MFRMGPMGGNIGRSWRSKQKRAIFSVGEMGAKDEEGLLLGRVAKREVLWWIRAGSEVKVV